MIRRPERSLLFSQFIRYASRLVYSEFGIPEKVLRLENFTQEKVSADVIVKMQMSPINPADINTIQGTYPIKPKSFPHVGGSEGFGIITSLGTNVTSLAVGDWVIPRASNTGTWSTEIMGSENDFIKIPKELSPVSAATIAANPCTAYRLLKDFVSLNPGDVIIQNGANSSVGQYVISIAKFLNLLSINIVRNRENIESLKKNLYSLGANYVLTEEELRDTSHSFHKENIPKPKLALNCIGGASSTELSRKLSPNGTHVTYGGMSLKPVIASSSSLIFKDICYRGFWLTKWNSEHDRKEMLDFVTKLALEGHLPPSQHKLISLKDYKSVVQLSGFINAKMIFDMRDEMSLLS